MMRCQYAKLLAASAHLRKIGENSLEPAALRSANIDRRIAQMQEMNQQVAISANDESHFFVMFYFFCAFNQNMKMLCFIAVFHFQFASGIGFGSSSAGKAISNVGKEVNAASVLLKDSVASIRSEVTKIVVYRFVSLFIFVVFVAVSTFVLSLFFISVCLFLL